MLNRVLRKLSATVVASGILLVPFLFSAHSAFAQISQPQVTPVTQADTSTVLGLVNYFVVQVIGSLTAFVGLAFDWFIQNFIINFGYHYQNTSFGFIINSMWGTVRDIFNLTFIFGLVYIGFQIILGINDSQAKRTIGWLILAALLVNFSLFITKFVVDFSNLLAVQVYNLFQSVDNVGIGADGTTIEVSITQAFVNSLGMSELFNIIPNTGQLLYVFCIFIVFLVLIYVFLAGAILVAIRFAALCLFMVFSPIMFIGWVFPGMGKYSTDFWRQFIGQAFFAPALLFMLYLSYRVTNAFSDETLRAPMSNLAAANNTDSWTSIFLSVIPFFIMTTVFLVASLVVAKRMSAVGANTAVSFGNSMQKSMRGSITSYMGRNTVGRSAEWLAKKNDQLEGSEGGRFAKRALTLASLGTLDERTRRAVLETGKKAKFGGSYSRSDDKAFKKELANTGYDQKEMFENKEKIARGLEALKKPESERNDADHAAVQAMSGAIAKMGLSDIEHMDKTQRKEAASFFTYAQMDKIGDSKELTDDEKYAIKSYRKDMIKKQLNIFEEKTELLSSELTKLTVEQLEEMGDEFILTYADTLSSAQMDDLKKSKKFSEYQKNRFSSVRSTQQKDENRSVKNLFYLSKAKKGSDGKVTIDRTTRRKPTDVAAAGRDVLLRSDALNEIDVNILEAIADKKTLNVEDRKTLGANIQAMTDTSPRVADMQNWLNSPQGQRVWGTL